MAALSCSRHCRHSLPLTFPLYLSVCPLHFICLSLYLSVSLSMFPTISLSVRLSVSPSLSVCSSACLLVVCYLHSTCFLLSTSAPLSPSLSAPLLHCALLVFISLLRCARFRSVSLCLRCCFLMF